VSERVEASIRPEQAGDAAAVDTLLRRAFGRAAEAELVARLRREALGSLALVAERAGSIAGHILFSAVTIEGRERSWPAVGLVRAGLDACAARGEGLVFVLGHPDYYPRFGFRLAARLGLRYGDGVFDGVFFLAELRPDAAAGRMGQVRYHPAFEGV
jgi:putative acetyltransferase